MSAADDSFAAGAAGASAAFLNGSAAQTHSRAKSLRSFVSGVRFKAGLLSKRHGPIAALTSKGGDGDVSGVPPPHTRDVAADVTVALWRETLDVGDRS